MASKKLRFSVVVEIWQQEVPRAFASWRTGGVEAVGGGSGIEAGARYF